MCFRKCLPTELDVSNQEILPLRGEFAKRARINNTVTIHMIPKMNHFIPWSRPDLIHDAILHQLNSQPLIRQSVGPALTK